MATKQIKDFPAVVTPAGGDELLTQQAIDLITRKLTYTQLDLFVRVPDADGTKDLGSAAARFRDLYLSRKAVLSDAAAAPAAAGEFQRQGAVLKFHDGTAARQLSFLETPQTFTADMVVGVEDARTNTVDIPFTVQSTTTGVPAPGIGTGVLFRAESADETPSDFGQIEFAASDVVAASEDTYCQMLLRVAGAALTAVYRFIATGAFKAIFTHANTADRTYTLPDKTMTVAGTDDVPSSYLAGLQLTNNAIDSAHDIDIALGVARNANNDGNLTLTSGLIKQIDASWAPGTNAGGLSSSLILSINTWYHVHLIRVSGSVDVGFDTSVIAANLIADHSATEHRRIGSVLTDGAANILGFKQVGDEFLWDDPPLDVNVANQGTAQQGRVLSVPTGIRVLARLNVFVTVGAGACNVSLRNPFVNDEAPSITAAPLATIRSVSGTFDMIGQAEVLTDTNSTINSRSDVASTTLRIVTIGWVDRRGRDD